MARMSSDEGNSRVAQLQNFAVPQWDVHVPRPAEVFRPVNRRPGLPGACSRDHNQDFAETSMPLRQRADVPRSPQRPPLDSPWGQFIRSTPA
jgi:hypothetical protein